jgi:hypothetical protein
VWQQGRQAGSDERVLLVRRQLLGRQQVDVLVPDQLRQRVRIRATHLQVRLQDGEEAALDGFDGADVRRDLDDRHEARHRNRQQRRRPATGDHGGDHADRCRPHQLMTHRREQDRELPRRPRMMQAQRDKGERGRRHGNQGGNDVPPSITGAAHAQPRRPADGHATHPCARRISRR